MNIRYWGNLQSPVDAMQKISAIAWSPNSKRQAVAASDRVIHFYDETGTKRDKFSIRPAEKENRSYIVRALAFSPDSQKLAVAQSDSIVFIYRLGSEWGDKKAICNKFAQGASVTCMTWPNERQGELVIGLADGKVKVCHLKTNKSQPCFAQEHFCVSICSSPDGQSIAAGFLDGSIIAMNLETKSKTRIMHTTIPNALAWGQHILAAGNDGVVAFYEGTGDRFHHFDYSKDERVKEFTCASFNATGETCVVGNFDRFYAFNYNAKRPTWDEICCKKIQNYYSVTAVAWKHDGSKIGIGSLCGSVDIFDVSLKKSRYKGKFEFTYVSLSQVIVRRLEGQQRIVLKSQYEIQKINVYQDRFLVAMTGSTIFLGDMESCEVSELPWRGSGNEKFDFSNPKICMIFNAGELSIIEYGVNEVIGTCRTENVHPNVISARLNYSKQKRSGGEPTKIIAYLLDQMTICVQNLSQRQMQGTITHDAKIDYLELNPGGTKLLFRDKRKQLYLYSIKEQTKQSLLNYCKFISWVPNSDVVVAQNRSNLCVWYSIEEPDKVTMYQIKGDVESIQRTENQTEVLVDDGNNTISYKLDDDLIEFGAALEYRGLDAAVEILEPADLTPETEANWKTLAKLAMEEQNLYVAERCYAALGDVAKADYLRKLNKLVASEADGRDNFRVQAKLAVFHKQFHQAEAILIEHDEIEEAMAMYQELHRWDESIKIAEKYKHQDVAEFKDNYFQWLLETSQEAKAAEVKEKGGDYPSAITLYLRGRLPAKAANVVLTYNVGIQQDQLEKIANMLISSNMHEKAGDFFEKLSHQERALDSFVQGHAFKKAVDLAKRAFPNHVVQLEEEWGDWLVSQRQLDQAVDHFIQAGAFPKAIESALSARNWNRAVNLVKNKPADHVRPYLVQIARHYAEIRKYDQAETFFVKAGEYVEAFEMYVRANKWEKANQLIIHYLPESQYRTIQVQEAQKFEAEGHYKEAEKMYLSAGEPDLAINMFKKAKMFDQMIRLVMKFRADLLRDTHHHLAQSLEMEGSLKQAEHHYIEGGSWAYAVDMYRAHEHWEEALRVAKANGNKKELGEVAIKIAERMGTDRGTQFLIKNGLIEAAIDFEANQDKFEDAFALAEAHARYKLPDVHLKKALHLEDDNRFKEAEEEFIKANKPQEAINMYEHKGDWHSAIQVARQYHPESVTRVQLKQAESYAAKGDFSKAETSYLAAKEAEKAIAMYSGQQMHGDALRVAQKHAPHLVAQINDSYSRGGGSVGQSGPEIVQSGKISEGQRDYSKAIDRYLEITDAHFPKNPEKLEEIWNDAFNLAMNYAKDRLNEVVDVVGNRLLAIGRYESAAEIFESVLMYDKAIEAHMQSNSNQRWDRALECAQQVRPHEMQQIYIQKIQEAKKSAYVGSGKISKIAQIVEGGDLSGLEILVQQNRWEECLELAEKQNQNVLNKFLAQYASHHIRQGQFKETARTLSRYNSPAFEGMLPAYKTIAQDVLQSDNDIELQNLREMLQKLVKNLETAVGDRNSPVYQEFLRYLTITHLLLLKSECTRNNLNRVTAKLATSLLRYCKDIRADKAFLDAGNACRAVNQNDMAFIFFNRYIDLWDLIVDPDANMIPESGEFEGTDIPAPYDIPLPEKNLLSEADRDQIRDWVLQINMDGGVGEALPTRVCEFCGYEHVYEASLKCPQCQNGWEPCIISGYPLIRSQAIHCKFCNMGALRDMWNDYVGVTQHCPWCNSMQTPY